MDSDVTLCLIVRDEEEFLGECLAATAPACADIVIVDTGSIDATKEIARAYTSRVYDFQMGEDFSAPCNAALDRVETEWALFLDADEHFIAAELGKVPDALAAAESDVHALRVLRYNFFATGGFYSGRVAKLIRNRPHVRYQRRVSESPRRSIVEAGGRVADAPLVLNHVGHTRPVATRAAKADRYVRLLRAHLAEHPHEAGIRCNAAMVLLSVGRLDEAMRETRAALETDASSAAARYAHGHALRAAGRVDEALDAYDAACAADPTDAAAHAMVGVAQLSLGRLDEADAALDRAASLDPLLIGVRVNQGLVLQARGEYARAADVFRAVAARNPGFLVERWRGRAEVDLYSCLVNETLVRFAGLGYHLAYCEGRGTSSTVPPATVASLT